LKKTYNQQKTQKDNNTYPPRLKKTYNQQKTQKDSNTHPPRLKKNIQQTEDPERQQYSPTSP